MRLRTLTPLTLPEGHASAVIIFTDAANAASFAGGTLANATPAIHNADSRSGIHLENGGRGWD